MKKLPLILEQLVPGSYPSVRYGSVPKNPQGINTRYVQVFALKRGAVRGVPTTIRPPGLISGPPTPGLWFRIGSVLAPAPGLDRPAGRAGSGIISGADRDRSGLFSAPSK